MLTWILLKNKLTYCHCLSLSSKFKIWWAVPSFFFLLVFVFWLSHCNIFGICLTNKPVTDWNKNREYDTPLKTVSSACQSKSQTNHRWQTSLVSWNHNTDVLILAEPQPSVAKALYKSQALSNWLIFYDALVVSASFCLHITELNTCSQLHVTCETLVAISFFM